MNLLELTRIEELRNWLGRLRDLGVVVTRGKTKGMEYFIAPAVLRNMAFQGGTTLKGIERHRLRELILRDLEIYKEASISQTHRRIGLEIPRRKLQHELKLLVNEGEIGRRGKLRHTLYLWTRQG